MFWDVIRVRVFRPSATLRATFRQTEAISRSRFRTPGLAGVERDDLLDRPVGDLDELGIQGVLGDLLGDEVLLGDLELLLLGVAGELQDFHPVAEGGLDGVEQVGRRDEHDLGQVVGHAQVVVSEGIVLLGVEDLEEGRGRVPPEIGADLVDLVHHEDGVVGPGPADALDDAAGHGPDIGPPVAPDLGLVPDAAERDADEAPAEGPGDGLAEGCLADAGRPDEAEDGTLDLLGELADAEVFEDALLDLAQAVMVLVEDLAGLDEVEVVDGRLVPGQGEHPVEVIADDRSLGRLGMHLGQADDLLLELLAGLVGDLDLLQPVLVGLDLLLDLRPLPELLLDGLHLLAEEVLLLELVHLSLGLGRDLRLDVEELELAGQVLIDLLETLEGIDDLQGLLGFLDLELEVAGRQVGQPARLVDVGGDDEDLGRNALAERGGLLQAGADVADEGLALECLLGVIGLVDDGDARRDVGLLPLRSSRPGPE